MTTLELTDVSERDTCVAIVPIFKGLSLDDQLNVAEVAEPETVKRGTTVFMEGESLTSLMVLHLGHIKLTRTSADGHEQLVRVIGPGDFIGERAFLRTGRAKYSAVALEETQMCVFEHRELATLFKRYPSVGLHMLVSISDRLEEMEARLQAIVSTDVGTRLADYLLGLPAHTEGHYMCVALPMAKKDIASLLDTTPESLSRHLRQFEDSGLIEQHGKKITLLDMDTLLDMTAQM